MPVPVDVIRFAFWITVFIECVYGGTLTRFSVLDPVLDWKFKNSDARNPDFRCGELKGSRICFFPSTGDLPQKRNERRGGHGKRSITPVGKSQFPVQFHVFQVDQLDPCQHRLHRVQKLR